MRGTTLRDRGRVRQGGVTARMAQACDSMAFIVMPGTGPVFPFARLVKGACRRIPAGRIAGHQGWRKAL